MPKYVLHLNDSELNELHEKANSPAEALILIESQVAFRELFETRNVHLSLMGPNDLVAPYIMSEQDDEDTSSSPEPTIPVYEIPV